MGRYFFMHLYMPEQPFEMECICDGIRACECLQCASVVQTASTFLKTEKGTAVHHHHVRNDLVWYARFSRFAGDKGNLFKYGLDVSGWRICIFTAENNKYQPEHQCHLVAQSGLQFTGLVRCIPVDVAHTDLRDIAACTICHQSNGEQRIPFCESPGHHTVLHFPVVEGMTVWI